MFARTLQVCLSLALAIALLPTCRGAVLRGVPPAANATVGISTPHLDKAPQLDHSLLGSSNSRAWFNFNASSFNTGDKIKANRPARIFFLFMAVDKVSNLGVWASFFAKAPPSQYRALIHCKLPACLTSVQNTFMIPVPTVPSYYCTDLVSPMNQLLGHALNNEVTTENPADKFIFVSDSTLPAKPFSQIYATLALRQGSDFCSFPANEWADIPSPAGGLEIAVKVHQWIVLERAHALNACIMWASGKDHDLMHRFQMNWKPFTWTNNTYADTRNFGCLDEFWHMAALYGTLSHVDAARDAVVSLQMFTNTPLRVSGSVGWQGACDTFVMWAKYLHAPGNNPFLELHTSLDPASVPHGGNDQRPGWWDTISTYGIQSIRKSGFLFVRKFIDNPRITDGPDFAAAWARVVFES